MWLNMSEYIFARQVSKRKNGVDKDDFILNDLKLLVVGGAGFEPAASTV